MGYNEEMSSVWWAAFCNLPKRKSDCLDGRYASLARLLGYKLYSTGGHFCGHNTIYNNACRGSTPKDPKMREKLFKLAGPHGKLIAWIALEKLGIADRYIKPDQW
jgi:hypothetical protein